MSMFTLAISFLTTFNLPWFTDLTFHVPMQYCSLQHQTSLPSPVTSTTGCCYRFGSVSSFFLELFLHWSPVAYWTPTNLGSYSFSILSSPFHTVHGVLKARILKWFAIPFTSGPHSVRPLHHARPSWIAPRAWLSFIELDKAVVRVIRLASFLWLWFQCVCPLMPSHNTYHLTWVSLTLDVGYLFMAALAKHSCCSLPWTRSPLLTLNWIHVYVWLSHPAV